MHSSCRKHHPMHCQHHKTPCDRHRRHDWHCHGRHDNHSHRKHSYLTQDDAKRRHYNSPTSPKHDRHKSPVSKTPHSSQKYGSYFSDSGTVMPIKAHRHDKILNERASTDVQYHRGHKSSQDDKRRYIRHRSEETLDGTEWQLQAQEVLPLTEKTKHEAEHEINQMQSEIVTPQTTDETHTKILPGTKEIQSEFEEELESEETKEAWAASDGRVQEELESEETSEDCKMPITNMTPRKHSMKL